MVVFNMGSLSYKHKIRDLARTTFTPAFVCRDTATICPGGDRRGNSVIGAGSVVVKDIPADAVAVGVLREIGEKDMEYYYRDRKIDPEDLKEEAALRND